MVHVAVNKYDFEKVNILEYAFGEGGGGHQKAYAVYAFINVDNCERPLNEIVEKSGAYFSVGGLCQPAWKLVPMVATPNEYPCMQFTVAERTCTGGPMQRR